MHSAELEDTSWAHDVASRWEASERKTRPLSEIVDELGFWATGESKSELVWIRRHLVGCSSPLDRLRRVTRG